MSWTIRSLRGRGGRAPAEAAFPPAGGRGGGPRFALRCRAAGGIAALFLLQSCALPYVPEANPVTPPAAAKEGVRLEPSGLEVAAFYYQTPEQLAGAFPRKWKWLWRSRVAVFRTGFATSRPGITEVRLEGGYLSLKNGDLYPLTSAGRAFDIAWGRGNPYVALSSTLYNAAVMLFTVLTLGLGNLVFVLPSPFSQPAPASEPLGRDLNDQMLPQSFRLSPGAVVSGLLYVALPTTTDPARLGGATLHLFLEVKGEGDAAASPVPLAVTLPTPPARG